MKETIYIHKQGFLMIEETIFFIITFADGMRLKSEIEKWVMRTANY